MAKKKTFSKLRNHLTSTELDEKASLLDEQMPTIILRSYLVQILVIHKVILLKQL